MSTVTGTRPVRRARISTTAIVFIVLVGVIALSAVLVTAAGKSFFTVSTLTSVLTLMSILGFVAIGQTLVIIAGSLDLSVPYVVSTASIVGAGIMAQGAAWIVPGVVVALLVCAAIGAANGLIVTKLRVHGFIATLGVGLIISGWLGTSFQGSFGSAPAEFRLLGATLIAGVPLSTIIMLVCAGLVALLLHRTRLGHHLYAVGGNAHVARLSGVRTQVPVVLAHILCSVLAGLAGLLLLARTSVGSPTIGSQGGYDLMSIAAVVLGGTLLAGGSGGVLGTVGGVAIFAVLDHVMGVLEVNPFFKDFVRGAVIIIAVALYAWRSVQRRPPRFQGKGTGA